MLCRKLPENLVNRPKTGFNPPLDDKVSCLGKHRIKEILNESLIYKYLSHNCIDMIINQHFDGRQNNTFKIWQLLYFSFWLSENQKSGRPAV